MAAFLSGKAAIFMPTSDQYAADRVKCMGSSHHPHGRYPDISRVRVNFETTFSRERETLMRISRYVTAFAVASIATLGLAACSSGDAAEPEAMASETSEAPSSDTADETTEATEDAPTDEATEETEETEETADTGSADGAAPWANPVTTPGTLLTTAEGTNFTVDIYQVGTAKATKTGQFVDPETSKPLIAEGDEIVFVNYVVTNTGTEPVSLGASLVSIDAKYNDWPYMQGMDSIVDGALFEAQGVNDTATKPDSYVDPFVLAWEPGTSYSYGQNFKYQAGSPITFTAKLTPVDDAGDLLHDNAEEVTAETTIS